MGYNVYIFTVNRKSKQMRTDLGKCTHLCDETQGTIKHKRFQQKVFVRCKKIEERSREKDRQGVEVNKMLRVVHSLP